MSNENAIRREVGTVALMFTGLGSIIGSGWLFGAWRAAQLAGPGAIYAWIIGAVVILFVALTYANWARCSGVRRCRSLRALFARFAGGIHRGLGGLDRDRVGDSRGSRSLGAIHEFLAVGLGAGPVCPRRPRPRRADRPGLLISAALVIVYFLLNFWSVKVFASTNSAITFFKLIVPAATAVALMHTGFHWENFQVGVHGGRHVGNMASILTAVATSGIVFSYNGFQSPVNLAGEARAPDAACPSPFSARFCSARWCT